MTNATGTLQTLLFNKLDTLIKEVRGLSSRVSKLEALVNLVSVPPAPTGKHPELVCAEKLYDTEAFPPDIDDNIAYATGYLSGRMGIEADKTALDFGPVEYRTGYELGKNVSTGEADVPTWDRTI